MTCTGQTVNLPRVGPALWEPALPHTGSPTIDGAVEGLWKHQLS